MRCVATGAVTSAPAPNPPTATPVDQASAVREPFDQDGDRHYVTQTNSGAADYPVAEVKPPQFVVGETRKENSQAVQKAAREGNNSGSSAIEQETTKKASNAQHKNTDRKGKS